MDVVGEDWVLAYDRDGELRVVRGPASVVCVHGKSLRVLAPTVYFHDGARVRCVECWLWTRQTRGER